jgi:hypothetical protein
MFGYPFSRHYLKTTVQRNTLTQLLTDQTFLSDVNYKKTPGTKVFFGEVSQFDFSLESISTKSQYVNFIQGRFLGADNDMYIEIKLGAFQHQRIFLMLSTILALLFAFTVYYASQGPQGFEYPEQFYQQYGYNTSIFAYNLFTPISLILLFLQLVIGSLIFVKYKNFKKSIPTTVQFFNQIFSSKEIPLNEVPTVLL